MHVWNVLHAARLKYRTPKLAICAPSNNFFRLYLRKLRHVSTIGEKNLLNSNNSPTCPYNTVNFGPLTAEICWRVWGMPSNFNGFHVLAALLHDTLVGVSQTLRRNWTEGTTYIRQGGIGPHPSSVYFFLGYQSPILFPLSFTSPPRDTSVLSRLRTATRFTVSYVLSHAPKILFLY